MLANDNSVGGLLVPKDIRLVVSFSALAWLIKYIFLLKFTVPKYI